MGSPDIESRTRDSLIGRPLGIPPIQAERNLLCEATFDALHADSTLLIRHRELAYIGAANRLRDQFGARQLSKYANDVFLGLPQVGITDLDRSLKQHRKQPLKRTKDAWVRGTAGSCPQYVLRNRQVEAGYSILKKRRFLVCRTFERPVCPARQKAVIACAG
jgi:hypothetical protein